MNANLKVVIFEEKKVIKDLLDLLDRQYDYIVNKEVVKMDSIVSELEDVSKKLAKLEIERRNIMGKDASLKELVESSNDEKLTEAYREIQKNLNMVEQQKKANEELVKNRLFYTKKMLNLLSPKRGNGTYNAYGQIRK